MRCSVGFIEQFWVQITTRLQSGDRLFAKDEL
jgi:hypothetical protein